MPRHLNILDQVRVAAPCSQDWEAMQGNDQVRFCHHCAKQVNNLSAMTPRQALRLVAKSNGNICAYYYQKPDGAPEVLSTKLARIPRRVSRAAASAFGALISLSAHAAAQTTTTNAPIANPPRAEVATPAQIIALPLAAREVRFSGGMVVMRRPAGELVNAVNRNNLAQVRMLLASGRVDVNEVDSGVGTTALIEAVQNGNREMVQELLHAGAQVNLRNRERETALMYLNSEATPELLQDLLSFGAKVNARDASGRTVLLSVVDSVKPEVLRLLLQAGARVNVADESKRTPLMMVAENQEGEDLPATLKLLLNAGADARAADEDGDTVLHYLANSVTPEVLELLLNAGADVRARNHEGATPLLYLASSEQPASLLAMIRAGADVDAADEEGTTPLMRAASNGMVDNLRVLLEAGAKPNLRDKEGSTALALVDAEEHPEAAKLLAQYGGVE